MTKENKKSRALPIASAIRMRFSLLRVFVACIILAVGILSIVFLHATSLQVQHTVQTHVSRLAALQEVRAVMLELGVLEAQIAQIPAFADRINSLQLMQEEVTKAQVLIGALILGSNSEAFKDAQNGNMLRLWRQNEYHAQFSLEPAPQELSEHAIDVAQKLDVLSQFVASSLQRAAIPTDATILEPAQAGELPTETLMENLVPAVESLAVLEAYETQEVAVAMRQVGQTDQTRLILIALFTLLGAAVTLFAEMLFSRRSVIGPLKELNATAQKIVMGDLSKRAVVHAHDEIGQLAEVLNTLAKKLQTSYDDMQRIVKEKTDALTNVLNTIEMKNEDLEKSQLATINLLEDLEEEKQIVEERVRQRTAELEHEKNKLLQVTSNMRGGGILLDEKFEVVFTNEAAYSLLHIPGNTPYASILGHFFAHFEGAEIKQYFKQCVDGDTFHVPEIDGHGSVYEIFFHHLKNNEQTSGLFILFFDVTDAKLLERSKSELVAVASHQLRTPLTAMRGNVEMLIDESFGNLNKEQHELLDDIEVSTIRLITMVNEMLDITKIERGNLEMNIEDLNVKEIVGSVVGDLEAYAERHDFTINETLSPDITIAGDRVRVRQIFQNLIDNAIKYSVSPGRLDISAKLNMNMVEIIFADNGIGVPKNEQSKLFERFYRASNTSKTASSGSGLGLYIVKSIAQQLGGDIHFQSEEGVGTTFSVALPIAHNNK